MSDLIPKTPVLRVGKIRNAGKAGGSGAAKVRFGSRNVSFVVLYLGHKAIIPYPGIKSKVFLRKSTKKERAREKTRERKCMEHDEQVKAEQLKKTIIKLMKWMTIPEQRRVYRLAYNVIEVPEHRGDPNFEKEPFPSAECTARRTQRLLKKANYQQTVKVASWQRKLLEARMKGGEE